MSILSVDLISPIGSGTTITLNATEVKTGNEITVGTGASIFSPAGNTLTFGTNNVEALRIKNTGFVGIKTSAPLAPLHAYNDTNNTIARLESGDATCRLHLKDSAGEGYVIASGDNLILANTSSITERLRIDSSGDIGLGESNPNRSGYSSPVVSVGYNTSNGYGVLELLGNKTSDSTIANIVAYNIGGSSRVAAIAFERSGANNSGAIRFETYSSGSAGERLRIKPSGEVQIGGVDQAVNRGASSIKAVADGGGAPINVYLQEVSGSEGYGLGVDSDGDLNFYNSGATSPTLEIKDDNNIAITDGNLVLASGHGISFAATADSGGTMENELLNDYEEGTWTPVYQNVNTPNYGHRSGRYTKIGRFVYLVCQISVDSGLDTSDGSTVNIGGFPFTGNNAHGSCLFTLGQYIDVMPDSTIDLFTNVRFNGNSVLLHEGRNNQDITYTQLNSSGNLQFACSYAL